MPTLLQVIRKGRTPKKKKSKAVALQGAPQRRGVCKKVYLANPKKPNSANRPMAVIAPAGSKSIIAYIPGEKHDVQQHGVLLFAGGGSKDTGAKYSVVRGPLDAGGVKDRKQGRSKYGTPKPKTKK